MRNLYSFECSPHNPIRSRVNSSYQQIFFKFFLRTQGKSIAEACFFYQNPLVQLNIIENINVYVSKMFHENVQHCRTLFNKARRQIPEIVLNETTLNNVPN